MQAFEIEKIVGEQGNRYAIVVLAAKRAQQIKDGSPPLVETTAKQPLTIALQEIAEGKVRLGTPEPEAEEGSDADAAGDAAEDEAKDEQ